MDRVTHLMIIVVTLVGGIAVLALGISVRLPLEYGDVGTARVLKDSELMKFATSDVYLLRGSLRTGLLRKPVMQSAKWVSKRFISMSKPLSHRVAVTISVSGRLCAFAPSAYAKQII
jgi:hypothetical protein